MIRDFWVSNYLSIRDKQELNFLAPNQESALTTEIAPKVFLYKLGILYGANAAGKSNMILALHEVFRLLVEPKAYANKPIRGYHPFLLDKAKPSQMHVSFYVSGIRYDYDVAFDGKYILSETLYYYPHNAQALFYKREFAAANEQATISFGASLKIPAKTQNSIRTNTLNNHSVLSVCGKIALKDITPFSNLYRDIIETYQYANTHHDNGEGNGGCGDSGEKAVVKILKAAFAHPKKRKFYNTMLQKADPNILRYLPVTEDRPQPVTSIIFVNQLRNGGFCVSTGRQAKGILEYIRVLEPLYELITGSHVCFLDNVGEHLHPDLLFYYLNAFVFNAEKSQLLMSSHETTLLSQDLLNDNRGAVWFVEKNRETAASVYSRGDSFGLPKDSSLYEAYRIGRSEGKPDLGSFFLELED